MDSYDRMCAYMGPSPTRSRFAEPPGGWAACEDDRHAMYGRIAVQVMRPPWAVLHPGLGFASPLAVDPERVRWFMGIKAAAFCRDPGDDDLSLVERVIRVCARTADDWRRLNELVDAVLGPAEVHP